MMQHLFQRELTNDFDFCARSELCCEDSNPPRLIKENVLLGTLPHNFSSIILESQIIAVAPFGLSQFILI